MTEIKNIKYKKPGLDWMPEFPAHWDVLRIKNLFQEMDGRSETGNEELLSVSYHTGVYLKRDSLENEDDHLTNASSLIGYKKVAKGDLIINIMGAWNGRLGISAYDGITSPAYCVYRLKGNSNPEYYGYLFRTSLYVTEFLKYSTGIGTGYLRLYSDKFFSIFTVVPPKDEQDEIVQYIKAQEEKINRFIEKKQRFIELLKEQRQRIITHVVTKGINEKVKLKQTGIQGLSEIPKHWEIRRLKNVKKQEKNAFVDGPFGSNLKSIHFVEEGEVYVVESGFITTGTFMLKEFKKITMEHFETIMRSECVAGDIIIAKIGANFGMCAELPKLDARSVVSGNSLKLTVDETSIYKPYLILFLNSLKKIGIYNTMVTTTAQPALSLGGMNDLKVLYPPIEEQKQIVAHIKTETATIDTAIAKAEREIELIREYKEAMIAEAVMGKSKIN